MICRIGLTKIECHAMSINNSYGKCNNQYLMLSQLQRHYSAITKEGFEPATLTSLTKQQHVVYTFTRQEKSSDSTARVQGNYRINMCLALKHIYICHKVANFSVVSESINFQKSLEPSGRC